MKTWIVDTGPIVALLSPSEQQHRWAVEQVRFAPTSMITCDAVISEACFLLKRDGQEAGQVFALIESGFLRSAFDLNADYRSVRALLRRYADTPMSFADACLVRMTESNSHCLVWTLDHDFRIYRQHGRQTIPLISPF